MIAGPHPGRVRRPALVDAGPLLRQLAVRVHRRGAAPGDPVVPGGTHAEAGAPGDTIAAVYAVLPAGRLRAAAVGPGRVLVHAQVLLEPPLAIRPGPAPAARALRRPG